MSLAIFKRFLLKSQPEKHNLGVQHHLLLLAWRPSHWRRQDKQILQRLQPMRVETQQETTNLTENPYRRACGAYSMTFSRATELISLLLSMFRSR